MPLPVIHRRRQDSALAGACGVALNDVVHSEGAAGAAGVDGKIADGSRPRCAGKQIAPARLPEREHQVQGVGEGDRLGNEAPGVAKERVRAAREEVGKARGAGCNVAGRGCKQQIWRQGRDAAATG